MQKFGLQIPLSLFWKFVTAKMKVSTPDSVKEEVNLDLRAKEGS
jgi:hypothetical protein